MKNECVERAVVNGSPDAAAPLSRPAELVQARFRRGD